jgi:hypothetical protein
MVKYSLSMTPNLEPRTLAAAPTSTMKIKRRKKTGIPTNLGNDVTLEIELQAMMSKPHTDCALTTVTFTWQVAGEGIFL